MKLHWMALRLYTQHLALEVAASKDSCSLWLDVDAPQQHVHGPLSEAVATDKQLQHHAHLFWPHLKHSVRLAKL